MRLLKQANRKSPIKIVRISYYLPKANPLFLDIRISSSFKKGSYSIYLMECAVNLSIPIRANIFSLIRSYKCRCFQLNFRSSNTIARKQIIKLKPLIRFPYSKRIKGESMEQFQVLHCSTGILIVFVSFDPESEGILGWRFMFLLSLCFWCFGKFLNSLLILVLIFWYFLSLFASRGWGLVCYIGIS